MIISSISLMVITDVPGLLTLRRQLYVSPSSTRDTLSMVRVAVGVIISSLSLTKLMEVSERSVSHCRMMLEPRRAYWMEGQT